MSQQTVGRAALVANNLPTSKSVTNATNATPIVVTTSTAHGLQVNDVFTISGVTGNTGANGTFIAGAVTNTTVTLLAYPAGTSVAGTGAYVSGGTLQSLSYGVTVPVPSDLTDMMQAGSVNVPHEAELDRLAYLLYRAGPSGVLEGEKVNRSGDTMTGDLHFAQTHGVVMDGSGGIINGTVTASGTWTNSGAWSYSSAGSVRLLGRKDLWRSRATMTDGNKKVSVASGTGIDYSGDRFNLPGTTAAVRTITLDSTVNVPFDGEMLAFFCQPVGLTINGSGVAFEFQRDDTSVAARVYWDIGNVPTRAGNDNFYLYFEYTGGAWTLSENIGSANNTANNKYVGVRLL